MAQKSLFDCGPVFEANYNSKADIVVNQGGTDSGKTYALIQLCYMLAVTTQPPKVDPIITILNESVPNSKKGAYRIARSIFINNAQLQLYVADWNNGDRIVTFRNGWVMEFVGATDEQNAKQGKRQYLFVNEANGIPWPIFWQMAKRTRVRTFIDYNPSAPFWAHEKLIGTTPNSNDLFATVQLVISDHRHNPFLSVKDHEKTENIKDKELWRVYARGMTGNLQGIIYPNWKRIPDKDYPWKEDGKFAGLDFGYTADETAGVRCVKIANTIFVHEICYAPGLAARALHKLFAANGFDNDEESPIYCEHDPDMIKQLRKLELLVVPARKGAGSINAGIVKVNEYQVCYTESSKNIDTERRQYMLMKDPDTGKLTNVPTGVDHLMDAIRYAIYTNFYRQDD